MDDLTTIIIFSFLAGITIFLGALLARMLSFKNKQFRDKFLHAMMSFGAGVLIAAVSLVLIPKAVMNLSLFWVIFLFAFGTIFFIVFDILLNLARIKIPQLVSMLLDFIPEALVLGASFALDPSFGVLLAVFIGLQNFPEGFNAYHELRSHYSKAKSLLVLFLVSFMGVFAAFFGRVFLHDNPLIVAGIMAFASGGILYLLFQDIAPSSKHEGTWIPATGASIGFLIGIIAEKIL